MHRPEGSLPQPRWSGAAVLRWTALFWEGLACILALAAHILAWKDHVLPPTAIISLIGVVFLGFAVWACYLNVLLQASLGLSLRRSLATLSAKPSDEQFREDQHRIHYLIHAWWQAVPPGLRWLTLPGTCYLGWLTYRYFVGDGDLSLFGNDATGLRMYSAVWLASSSPMLVFTLFCTRSNNAPSPP